MKEIIINLIRKNDELGKIQEGANNHLGWEISLPDVSKEILDLMGVPKDTTLSPEWSHLISEEPTDEDIKNGWFCRDYFSDVLYKENLSPEEKYEEITKTLKEASL